MSKQAAYEAPALLKPCAQDHFQITYANADLHMQSITLLSRSVIEGMNHTMVSVKSKLCTAFDIGKEERDRTRGQ